MNRAEEDALVEKIETEWVHVGSRSVFDAIRLAICAGVAHERERAAKVCESLCADYYPHAKGPYFDCAAAIRKGTG